MSPYKQSTKPCLLGFESNAQVTASARDSSIVQAVAVFAAGLYKNHLHCSHLDSSLYHTKQTLSTTALWPKLDD